VNKYKDKRCYSLSDDKIEILTDILLASLAKRGEGGSLLRAQSAKANHFPLFARAKRA
jgi:hypothetical protein